MHFDRGSGKSSLSHTRASTVNDTEQYQFLYASHHSSLVKTSESTVRMEPSTPRAASASDRESRLDDLFEGEPDPNLFNISSPGNFDAIAAWLTARDPDRTEMQIKTSELPMLDDTTSRPVASGALGDGDIPYSDSACRQRHETLATRVDIGDHISTFTKAGSCQVSRPEWNDPELGEEWIRKRTYLASLEGEVFDRYTTEGAMHNCEIYSATGSTESISMCEEESRSAWDDQDIEDARPKAPPAQAGHENPDFVSSVEQKGDGLSQNDESGELHVDVSTSESIHSAIWHSKPYLSEVTLAETQGQHPSIICRSSHSNKSRTSSLVDELLGEEELQPSHSVCYDADKSLESDIGVVKEPVSTGRSDTVHSDTLLSVNNVGSARVSWHASMPLNDQGITGSPSNNTLSNPRFDVQFSNMTEPSTCTTTRIESGHTAYADTDSNMPTPTLPSMSFQYNSARLTPPLQSSGASEGESTYDLSVSQPAQVPISCRAWPGFWERIEDDISHNPWTESKSHSRAAADMIPVVAPPLRSQGDARLVQQVDQLHKGAEPIDGQPELDELRTQNIDAPDSSATLDVSMSSPCSPPPPVLTPMENGSSLSSPLTGLQDAIRLAERGSRKGTNPRRATVNLMSTRGRAVSASPSKCKTIVNNKNATATSVQGEATKINKTRKTRSDRAASRKAATVVKGKDKTNDDSPTVPNSCYSMGLDLPSLQSLPDAAQKQEQIGDADVLIVKGQGLDTVAVATILEASIDATIVEKQESPRLIQPVSHVPASLPQMPGRQLHVPKTRKPAKSKMTMIEQRTTSNPDYDRLTAIIAQVSEQAFTETILYSSDQPPTSPLPPRPAITTNLTRQHHPQENDKRSAPQHLIEFRNLYSDPHACLFPCPPY